MRACTHCAAGAPFKAQVGVDNYHVVEVGGGYSYAPCEPLR
jgi:hypothetical protein